MRQTTKGPPSGTSHQDVSAALRSTPEQTGLGLVRALNEQRVLETLVRDGPLSRARIASLTGLSKPTVSSVMSYLETCGLVREQGRASGGIGRPSILYETVDRAGLVYAVDLGSSKIRAGIADPYGDVVAEATEPTTHEGGRQLVDQIAKLFLRLLSEAHLDRRLVWATGIGVPGIYDPATERVSSAPNLPAIMELPLARALRSALQTPVEIDNDVNLAAVGERWRGQARDRNHFVAISIGTGIGMGVVIDGEIYRGSRGAAGEIDFLPLGTDPFQDHQKHGPLEAASTGPAIVRRMEERVRAGANTADSIQNDVASIFAAAEDGDELALQVVDEEARTVALAIAAIASVLDPELVVLGGGVGSNPGLLVPVRKHVERIFPRPLEIGTSALGNAAAFYGAIAVALRSARQELVAQMAGAR